jgi:hypothetical protein
MAGDGKSLDRLDCKSTRPEAAVTERNQECKLVGIPRIPTIEKYPGD